MKNNAHPFLNPSSGYRNTHLYYIRKSILLSLIVNRDQLQGTLLDVGCGQMPYKQLILESGAVANYIGLDLENNPIHSNNPDMLWNGIAIPLPDNSVDSVLLTEVLEHAPEPTELLREIHRVMKPGGKIFGTVPFLFPLHEVPYDFYRYTPFSLERFAEKTGFRISKIGSLGGWDASLAQMIGMWLRSAIMSRISRAVFTVFLYPLYLWLIYRENQSVKNEDRTDFRKQPMITGLYFIFEKQSTS